MLGSRPAPPVQRWKMWVVLFVGISLVNTPLTNWLSTTSLSPIARVLVGGCLTVLSMVYLLIPMQLALMRRWIFTPWDPSPNPLTRFLQSGFPCLQ